MSLKDSLIAAARAYCAATGMSMARLATVVANDGKFFARLEAGGDTTLGTYERIMARLASASSGDAAPGDVSPAPSPSQEPTP